MSNKGRFSLDDLNELSEGLGDRICRLIDGHNNYAGSLQAKKEIDGLLATHKLNDDDVMVNRGLAEGLTIKAAFANASSNYQFQDQFDA